MAKSRTAKRKRAPARDGSARGRTPKLLLQPDTLDKVCAAVRMGNTYRDSCKIAGISEPTMYRWLENAEDPKADECYREFRDALERARAEGKTALAGMIYNAAKGIPVFDKSGQLIGFKHGDWRAAAHILSIRDREGWAKRHHLELAGDKEAPIGVQICLPPWEGEDDDPDSDEPGGEAE